MQASTVYTKIWGDFALAGSTAALEGKTSGSANSHFYFGVRRKPNVTFEPLWS